MNLATIAVVTVVTFLIYLVKILEAKKYGKYFNIRKNSWFNSLRKFFPTFALVGIGIAISYWKKNTEQAIILVISFMPIMRYTLIIMRRIIINNNH